jgi:hypothetical protein
MERSFGCSLWSQPQGQIYFINLEIEMRKIILIVVMILLAASYSYCAEINIGELVDQYQHATDVQKQELEKNFIGKRITARGIVNNVSEYNFFDINTDTGEKYYRVVTRQQDTAGKTPYQVVFMYKDKSKIAEISRGETIDKEGILINIVDERLQISMWIYEDELTSKDKELFKIQ